VYSNIHQYIYIYIDIYVQQHIAKYIGNIYIDICVCTPNTVKLGPLTGLEIASFFLLRMNFHLQVFLSFPSKYFSSPPPSISLLHLNIFLFYPSQVFLSFTSKYFSPLCQLVAPSNYSSIHQGVLGFRFILVAPCLTPRLHFRHPGSWRSLPHLEPRCLSSS